MSLKKELADKEQWQAAALANLKARKQECNNKKHASTAASASTSNKQSEVVNLESARTKMKLPLQRNQALPSKDHHPNSSVSWRNQWDSQYQASKSLPDKSVQQTQSLSDGNKKPPATEQLTERGKLLANVCLSTKKDDEERFRKLPSGDWRDHNWWKDPQEARWKVSEPPTVQYITVPEKKGVHQDGRMTFPKTNTVLIVKAVPQEEYDHLKNVNAEQEKEWEV